MPAPQGSTGHIDTDTPLLHCPFSGPGQSQVGLWFDDVSHRYRVGCGRCRASTGTHPTDNPPPAPAIAAWNTRAG